MALTPQWSISFLSLFTLHALTYLLHVGWLSTSLPYGVTAGLSLLTLAALFLLGAVNIARQDEVILLMCLKAASVSLAGVVLAGYALVAVVQRVDLLAWMWALAMFVFLVIYGGLWWRARS